MLRRRSGGEPVCSHELGAADERCTMPTAAETAAAGLLGGLSAVLVYRARWRRRPIVLFDPHFHVWDIREPEGYGDPSTLFSPASASVAGVYDSADFERDWASLPSGFVLAGGVFVEAVSCCFKAKSPSQLAPHCLKEAAWVQATLAESPGQKEYFLVATACLEDPAVGDVLKQLAANKRVRGIRQVLNVSPDWPRSTPLRRQTLDQQIRILCHSRISAPRRNRRRQRARRAPRQRAVARGLRAARERRLRLRPAAQPAPAPEGRRARQGAPGRAGRHRPPRQ